MKLKALSRKSNNESKGNSILLPLLKGTLISLGISLFGILIFAFVLRFTNISDVVISPVNQVIKGVSIFLGVFIGLKKEKELGLVSGLLIGVCYTVLAFFVFSLLDGAFEINRTLLNDILFGGIIGGICGIICVNLKKK
ncbi:MAG: TIGR04086 family membrane protein [Clostridia bacterium]|nr:TIGR04086 family membrane protein [Clostridia bacterium]